MLSSTERPEVPLRWSFRAKRESGSRRSGSRVSRPHASGGFRVLSSRPAEAERGLAHSGLGDLFEDVLEQVLPELPAPRRRALEIALLLEEGAEPPADPRALAVAVRTTLEALAEDGPVVVAIDDVQWLDASSGSALAFALRRLEADVRLLLTRRVAEGVPASELEKAIDADRIERLYVGPLSVGATHQLLRQRLGRTFARPTLLRLHEASGGNPFYALELARALGPDVDPTQPLPVPETLEELLSVRRPVHVLTLKLGLGLRAQSG